MTRADDTVAPGVSIRISCEQGSAEAFTAVIGIASANAAQPIATTRGLGYAVMESKEPWKVRIAATPLRFVRSWGGRPQPCELRNRVKNEEGRVVMLNRIVSDLSQLLHDCPQTFVAIKHCVAMIQVVTRPRCVTCSLIRRPLHMQKNIEALVRFNV
jgi:hypothetical protein